MLSSAACKPVAGHRWTAEGVRRLVWCGIGFALAAALLTVSGVGCPFRFFTGVCCPGCGMTRAYLALLSGDVPAAFAYHPLFWAVGPVALIAMFQGRMSCAACGAGEQGAGLHEARALAQAARAVLLVAGIAFIALWVLRMASPNDAGLLFSGQAPAGVQPDIVHMAEPRWLGFLREVFGA